MKKIKGNIFKKVGIGIFLIMFVLNLIMSSYGKEIITSNERARQFSSSLVSMVEELQRKHPNWKFEYINTGYDFNQIAKAQFAQGRGLNNDLAPINLIESFGGTRYGSEWVDPERAHLAFDANPEKKRWQAPSIEAIRYFLDPRTYLTENDVFTFLALQGNFNKFDENTTKNMIRTVLKGTKNESRVDEIYRAVKYVDIDVLEIATKLKQEGGLEPNRGIYAYNPLNVGATGRDPELTGLEYARDKGWDTFEKGLIGCAEVVKRNYIGRNQDTKYLMKFNVANNSIYHQYMQNVSAPLSEGKSLKNAYKSYDTNLNGSYTFKIPLFDNMPANKVPRPRKANSNENAAVTTDLLYIRSRPGINNSERIGSLRQGEGLKVFGDTYTSDGYRWYRIEKNGQIGYIARNKLSDPDNIYFEIYENDGSNQEDLRSNLSKYEILKEDDIAYPSYAVITVDAMLRMRNSAKLDSLSTIEIPNDEIIKVIDKYGEKEGYIWYRVEYKGQIGFVARNKVNSNIKNEDLSNSNDINFRFIKKDNIPHKRMEDVDKKVEKNPIKQNIKNEEKEPLNLNSKLDGKVKVNNKYIYFAWDIDLKEFLNMHPNMQVFTKDNKEIDIKNLKEAVRFNEKIEKNINKEEYKVKEQELYDAFKNGNYIVLNTNKNGINYIEKYKLIRKGDVNSDGKIGIADLIKVISNINEETTLEEIEKLAAYIQVEYDKEALEEYKVNILTASNLTYAILQTIRNKYDN